MPALRSRKASPRENEGGIGFLPDPDIRCPGVPPVKGDIHGLAGMPDKADDVKQPAMDPTI